ncbi:N-acetyltransferase [Microtetraspora sp. NBRC 16547]|nr:N-acetyltransferase [Microtetraspora sp. NBRC 16547]
MTNDIETVAALHTMSWRTAYAGLMPDSYLNGPLLDERANLWRGRLTAEPRPGGDTASCLLIAEDGDAVSGFVYLFLQDDGRILLDNLHVSPELKRSGIGRRLMHRAFGWASANHPGRDIYLEVLRDNDSARAFYLRMGGRLTREFVERFPAGFDVDVVEYTWDPAAVSSVLAPDPVTP